MTARQVRRALWRHTLTQAVLLVAIGAMVSWLLAHRGYVLRAPGLVVALVGAVATPRAADMEGPSVKVGFSLS